MIKRREVASVGFASAVAVVSLLASGFVDPANAASGWQTPSTFAVPTGETSLFYHYPCPSNAGVVWNGGYSMNSIGQTSEVYLGFNGPRLDESPVSYAEWGWHFYWPGGAPAGITITFNVFCGWDHSF